MVDVVVVGAGLSGLACAITARELGLETLVLEAADAPGGRVRTDLVDGFLVDRGFQVLLTAYPAAIRMLDFDELELRRFDPGAVVYIDGTPHRVADPFRMPSHIWTTLRAPIGSMRDKLAALSMRRRLGRAYLDDLFDHPELNSREWLNSRFSESFIDAFVGPLVSGMTLDPDFAGPASITQFFLKMLIDGDAAVPSAGMQAIPDQLASRAGRVRYSSPVSRVAPGHVQTEAGETIKAGAIVVATDGPSAADLLDLAPVPTRPAGAIWFAAEETPVEGHVLVLDGSASGPVNSVAVMSEVAPRYSSDTRSLIVCQVLGVPDPALAQRQLTSWFGPMVESWEVVALQHIPHAVPVVDAPVSRTGSPRLGDGVYVAGDHRATPSIDGALSAGGEAAEAVWQDQDA